MALAILELLAFDGANVRFRIDTGTNKYYLLKAGKRVERRNGIDWVDEIFLKTRIARNEAGGDLFNSSKEIAIPATRLGAGHAYVQLFSFKTPDGKSPAFSRVINVPVSAAGSYDAPDYDIPMSMFTSMNTLEPFRSPRTAPCRTCRDVYSQPASLDELLAGIVKVASPIVMNLLGRATGPTTNGTTSSASNPSGSNASGDTAQADTLVRLLTTLLGSLGGAPAAANTSRPQSLLNPIAPVNRFATQTSTFAQPFIFGIDDALLGALAGPIVQMLPQLMTAANQKRVELKKANNKLITDILSDVNRRLLMEHLLEAQRQPPVVGQADNTAAINQVLQLLQQTGAAPSTTDATAATNTTTPATTQSLSLSPPDNALLSSKAVVEFVSGDPVAWNGGRKVLFARGQDVQLKVQLKTAEPPKSAMPKAIIKITLQDAADQSVRFEKTFKQKDISANTPLSFPFTAGELAHLPANRPISLLAEMRWRTKSGAEYKALGASEIVLANKYFYKEQGGEVGAEQELTDMKRFRPFWNQVWEAPSLDVSRGGEKKYLWELNANAKYTVLLSADHDANGLMQTKLLRGKQDAESLSETVEGRMKAGIELSLSELNKLLPLWKGEAVLDREKLEALQSGDFVKNNSGEFVYNLKLKGRAAERGMIWVIPVFKLFECGLGTIGKTDDAGQVIAISEEKIHFPLPVSARVIGLKSQS
jgi:hypothetical protein